MSVKNSLNLNFRLYVLLDYFIIKTLDVFTAFFKIWC